MNFNNILFLDIETASQFPAYDDLPDDWKELWDHKAVSILRGREGETPGSVYNRAGIYAEFGKVVCVSCGCLQGAGSARKIIIKSFYSDNENALLQQVAEMLNKWSAEADKFICAHNGKEFDFPYLCRRMVINGINIPEALQISGRKPWELKHLLDTMELWKFGDFKAYTSLKLLAHVLGIPSPKDDIDGSMVNEVYWAEKNLERIAVYCQKDVVTLAQVLLRMYCEPAINPENVNIKWHKEPTMPLAQNGKAL